jgi:SulP family sulfate permease
VLVTTFVLTVVFDLVIAIEIGMLFAVLLFIKRMSEESAVVGWKYYDPDEDPDGPALKDIPAQVRVYEIYGPMFFGSSGQIDTMNYRDETRVIIIRMRGVPALDATAMHSLEQFFERCEKRGITLVFSHVNEQPMQTMMKSGFVDRVGKDNFRPHIDDAISHARSLLAE